MPRAPQRPPERLKGLARLLDRLGPFGARRRSELAQVRGGGGPPSRRFEGELRRHEQERHARIREEIRSPVRPHPPGFRAEDCTGGARAEGFLPMKEAAAVMGLVDEETRTAREQLLDLVRGGLLEARAEGGTVYVRPAIVTVTGAKES
jgi:hypothetical protein